MSYTYAILTSLRGADCAAHVSVGQREKEQRKQRPMVHGSGRRWLRRAVAQEALTTAKTGRQDLGEEIGGGFMVVAHDGDGGDV